LPQDPQHIIQKSQLKLQMASQEGAYDLQTRVLEIFKRRVLPRLDAEMTAAAPGQETIRLDRLELNLGKISEGDLTVGFTEKLVRTFQEELRKQLHPEAVVEGVEKMSRLDGVLDVLAVYLEKGYLPWQVQQADFSLEKALTDLLASRPEALQQLLQRIYTPQVWKRLVRQLPEAALVQMLKQFAPEAMAEFIAALRKEAQTSQLRKTFFPNLSQPIWAAQLWELAIAWSIFSDQLHPRLKEFAGLDFVPRSNSVEEWTGWFQRAVVLQLEATDSLSTDHLSKAQLVESMRVLVPGMTLKEIQELETLLESEAELVTEVVQKALQQTLAEIWAGTERGDWRGVARHWVNLVAQWEQEEKEGRLKVVLVEEALENFYRKAGQLGIEPNPKALRPSRKAKSTSTPKRKGQPEELLYINNAGLVLLNPFFQTAFENYGWWADGQFKDSSAREDAMWFVQLVGSHDPVESEADLILAKILVGMPLEEPVRLTPNLPEEMVNETDELVQAAVGYWSKLGQLSATDFRAAFVRREGRLKASGDGWQLKVDRQTLDILMEYLPWSIGVVRLPWMEHLLVVDW